MKTEIWVQGNVSYGGRYNIFIKIPGELSKMLAYHCSKEETDRLLEHYIQKYKVEKNNITGAQ